MKDPPGTLPYRGAKGTKSHRGMCGCCGRVRSSWDHSQISTAPDVHVSALAINVTIPDALGVDGPRCGETFILTTFNTRLLPDGHLAVKAYGRPTGGGRGTYTSFSVPDRPELAALIEAAADRAGALWTAHRGLR